MQSISKNATGNLVKYLKANLKKLGFSVTANSDFDAATETAIKSFQTQKGLTVDGIVGINTWVQIYLSTVTARTTNSRNERNNNILLLHPVVRKAVVATYVQLQAEGIPFAIFEAYRFPQRQQSLYAQGRTAPGNIVTYAKPWSSYHQYGLAVDFVLFVNNEWSWDSKTAQQKQWWKKLHKIGESENLMRLDFETPHLQIMGTSSNALKEGMYPPNGDETWAENFNASIFGWSGEPTAPPLVQHNATRPGL
jgi:peptidoglycan L-alanyl-D-glutamate endopeptidase CwlK